MNEEMIEILRRDGSKIGRTVPKTEIHKIGYWHRAVHVWIINSKNEVLLQRRSAKKDHNANMWDVSVGGHVTAGESSLQTVLREINEKLGLDKHNVILDKNNLYFDQTFTKESILNNGSYKDNELIDLYVLKQDLLLRNMSMQVEEVQELEYVSLSALQERILKKDPTLVRTPSELERLFQFLQVPIR